MLRKSTKRFNESAFKADKEVIQWAKDFMEDRLYEMEDMEIDLDELAFELTDRENIDGGVFYNNKQALDFIMAHRIDAAEILDKIVDETGACKPNPLSDPDAFCVVWLIEVCRDILSHSDTVQDGGKTTLTIDLIEQIIDEIKDVD